MSTAKIACETETLNNKQSIDSNNIPNISPLVLAHNQSRKKELTSKNSSNQPKVREKNGRVEKISMSSPIGSLAMLTQMDKSLKIYS